MSGLQYNFRYILMHYKMTITNLIIETCKNVKVLITQLCLSLCDPMDCSLSGSSVHGILQASTLEWVAIPFSRTSSCPRDGTQYYKPGSILGSNDQALNKTDTFPSVMELTELFTEILTS